MRRRRVVVASVALGSAVLVALLASDIRAWRNGVEAGDRSFVGNPAGADWASETLLPGRVGRSILGLSDDLAYRRALRAFVAVESAGCGIDNCYSESQARTNAELELSNLAQSSDRVRAAVVDNLLGILAFADSQPHGAGRPAAIERSVADFQAAVRLDPENEDAKFNLEWLLHRLVARGTRRGGTAGEGGPATGRRGAAGGVPGKGY